MALALGLKFSQFRAQARNWLLKLPHTLGLGPDMTPTPNLPAQLGLEGIRIMAPSVLDAMIAEVLTTLNSTNTSSAAIGSSNATSSTASSPSSSTFSTTMESLSGSHISTKILLISLALLATCLLFSWLSAQASKAKLSKEVSSLKAGQAAMQASQTEILKILSSPTPAPATTSASVGTQTEPSLELDLEVVEEDEDTPKDCDMTTCHECPVFKGEHHHVCKGSSTPAESTAEPEQLELSSLANTQVEAGSEESPSKTSPPEKPSTKSPLRELMISQIRSTIEHNIEAVQHLPKRGKNHIETQSYKAVRRQVAGESLEQADKNLLALDDAELKEIAESVLRSRDLIQRWLLKHMQHLQACNDGAKDREQEQVTRAKCAIAKAQEQVAQAQDAATRAQQGTVEAQKKTAAAQRETAQAQDSVTRSQNDVDEAQQQAARAQREAEQAREQTFRARRQATQARENASRLRREAQRARAAQRIGNNFLTVQDLPTTPLGIVDNSVALSVDPPAPKVVRANNPLPRARSAPLAVDATWRKWRTSPPLEPRYTKPRSLPSSLPRLSSPSSPFSMQSKQYCKALSDTTAALATWGFGGAISRQTSDTPVVCGEITVNKGDTEVIVEQDGPAVDTANVSAEILVTEKKVEAEAEQPQTDETKSQTDIEKIKESNEAEAKAERVRRAKENVSNKRKARRTAEQDKRDALAKAVVIALEEILRVAENTKLPEDVEDDFGEVTSPVPTEKQSHEKSISTPISVEQSCHEEAAEPPVPETKPSDGEPAVIPVPVEQPRHREEAETLVPEIQHNDEELAEAPIPKEQQAHGEENAWALTSTEAQHGHEEYAHLPVEMEEDSHHNFGSAAPDERVANDPQSEDVDMGDSREQNEIAADLNLSLFQENGGAVNISSLSNDLPQLQDVFMTPVDEIIDPNVYHGTYDPMPQQHFLGQRQPGGARSNFLLPTPDLQQPDWEMGNDEPETTSDVDMGCGLQEATPNENSCIDPNLDEDMGIESQEVDINSYAPQMALDPATNSQQQPHAPIFTQHPASLFAAYIAGLSPQGPSIQGRPMEATKSVLQHSINTDWIDFNEALRRGITIEDYQVVKREMEQIREAERQAAQKAANLGAFQQGSYQPSPHYVAAPQWNENSGYTVYNGWEQPQTWAGGIPGLGMLNGQKSAPTPDFNPGAGGGMNSSPIFHPNAAAGSYPAYDPTQPAAGYNGGSFYPDPRGHELSPTSNPAVAPAGYEPANGVVMDQSSYSANPQYNFGNFGANTSTPPPPPTVLRPREAESDMPLLASINPPQHDPSLEEMPKNRTGSGCEEVTCTRVDPHNCHFELDSGSDDSDVGKHRSKFGRGKSKLRRSDPVVQKTPVSNKEKNVQDKPSQKALKKAQMWKANAYDPDWEKNQPPPKPEPQPQPKPAGLQPKPFQGGQAPSDALLEEMKRKRVLGGAGRQETPPPPPSFP